MRYHAWCALVYLVLTCNQIDAAEQSVRSSEANGSPKSALRRMIEDDMKGDASARLDLASKSATSDMALCNQLFDEGSIAYTLDDGGMQIATSWQFDDHA
jgi:hypothetical protein